MRVAPFSALHPPPGLASEVAAVPYDVVDTAEATALAAGKPRCFLRISRAELELPEGTDPHSDGVYERAAANFARFQREGALVREPHACLYVYRITKGDHAQTGVVGCCHVGDYAGNVIRRHEKTRADKENDRTRHMVTVRAHTGPVFLTYRDVPAIDRIVAEVTEQVAMLQADGEDGSQHTIWKVTDPTMLQALFAAVPVSYIADGHHRAAAAVRAASALRAASARPRDDDDYNWFMAVLFPADQLRILPYNRCVKDLNGLTPAAFLARVRQAFRVTDGAPSAPAGARQAAMYLAGRWYGLAWDAPQGADPVSGLDVSVLQDRLLAPILGIDDPRTNARIEFVGGIRGTDALVKRVDSGASAAAFAMYPVTVTDMMAIADAGQIMPPKSTWFEPKLRSGLLVHTF
ncbi:MAG: DUF1015 family protein [Lentisphaerae bacterium]|nr:DUF1015 family protein [Lentisphaerota bacterium]